MQIFIKVVAELFFIRCTFLMLPTVCPGAANFLLCSVAKKSIFMQISELIVAIFVGAADAYYRSYKGIHIV